MLKKLYHSGRKANPEFFDFDIQEPGCKEMSQFVQENQSCQPQDKLNQLHFSSTL
jgi:hypothetical protein